MPEYIDREAALSIFEEKWESEKAMADAINEIPAADVATVIHAHWKRELAKDRPTGYRCTNPKCGVLSCCKGAYCMACGAKMDEEVPNDL